MGDIPGVCFKMVKVASVSLWLCTKARRPEGKTKIINFDSGNKVINFHMRGLDFLN